MKKIMKISGTHTYNSSVFTNSDEEDDGVQEEEIKEDVFSVHDFHNLPPLLRSSPSRPSVFTNHSSANHNSYANVVTREKVGTSSEANLISLIDRKMQEHTDNLLHAVGGLSVRLCKLDSKSCQVEQSLDELKKHIEDNQKSTDGKLRLLENMLREVQGGVLDLKDKQDIAEAQLQLSLLEMSKRDLLSKRRHSSARTDLVQKVSSSASQSHKPLQNPLPHNAPLIYPYHPEQPAAAQLPTQALQYPMPSIPQPECYDPPCAPTQEATDQQYHRTPIQQLQPPPPPPNQPYNLAFQFAQIQQHQLHSPVSTGSPHVHLPTDYQAEGSSYITSQSHEGIHQTYSQPPCEAPPAQQFYMGSMQNDHSLNRASSKFTTGYLPPSGHTSSSEYNPHTGSSSFYVSSGEKPIQLVPPLSVRSGESSYPPLPTAKILPHALPTASSVTGGSDFGGTRNRVPVDDVVDKVSAMGFRRDQVIAMVKKLTDNGQAVDLNVVLDKLMNNG